MQIFILKHVCFCLGKHSKVGGREVMLITAINAVS